MICPKCGTRLIQQRTETLSGGIQQFRYKCTKCSYYCIDKPDPVYEIRLQDWDGYLISLMGRIHKAFLALSDGKSFSEVYGELQDRMAEKCPDSAPSWEEWVEIDTQVDDMIDQAIIEAFKDNDDDWYKCIRYLYLASTRSLYAKSRRPGVTYNVIELKWNKPEFWGDHRDKKVKLDDVINRKRALRRIK